MFSNLRVKAPPAPPPLEPQTGIAKPSLIVYNHQGLPQQEPIHVMLAHARCGLIHCPYFTPVSTCSRLSPTLTTRKASRQSLVILWENTTTTIPATTTRYDHATDDENDGKDGDDNNLNLYHTKSKTRHY